MKIYVIRDIDEGNIWGVFTGLEGAEKAQKRLERREPDILFYITSYIVYNNDLTIWEATEMKENEMKELIKQAKQEVEVAENHLNFADKEFIDIAIMELSLAMKKLDVIIKYAKEHEA